MKNSIILLLLSSFILLLDAQELKVKSNSFTSDQNSGISVFSGDVNILKGQDELNASKVTIYVNKEKKPTKFVADGNVSFNITSKDGAVYKGVSGRAIYLPNTKEYYFYENVHLQQLNDKKEIMGDEVVLKTTDGKAYAKGMKKEPVIMIFNIDEEKK
ncbi:lipopolysaccharide transport periplasmic protein LptA [Sulfurimonas paralvinellae]|uniref:Lipopolysaccharide transport periplasmic protein LptA n=1 Tax=Sulfurimonas paralvinellae TaxID=317658 RepID=A0A7M1B7F7_9BACT|nr:lipopolysaccharide transport periplasmic protein LptA [Sulfurimonas paralvinellae]QOP45667.1 lipopolysaccharide transport periplasmic protein LptA [Sulfurimonas paralvinellae]